MSHAILNGRTCCSDQLRMLEKNFKNGSISAYLNGDDIEYYEPNRWIKSTHPYFDTLEYRIKVKRYRPLTPKEAIEYLGETIESGYFYKLVSVGETHVKFERDNYQCDVSYYDLMDCKHNNVLLRREVDE